MLNEVEVKQARGEAAAILSGAGIVINADEEASLEIAEFGLDEWRKTGMSVLVYCNTQRCCAKELVLLPGQTCPEHYHPPFDGTPGKEETFRVRKGTVYLYVEGEPTPNPRCKPTRSQHYTAWHEVKLEAGDQYTIPPMTKHWFQAPDGEAIVSEFSTQSRDEFDVFTDPDIRRVSVARG
jgi:D-lyxose ketol-isomerase